MELFCLVWKGLFCRGGSFSWSCVVFCRSMLSFVEICCLLWNYVVFLWRRLFCRAKSSTKSSAKISAKSDLVVCVFCCLCLLWSCVVFFLVIFILSFVELWGGGSFLVLLWRGLFCGAFVEQKALQKSDLVV